MSDSIIKLLFFVGKIFRLYINKFARTIIFFLLISDLLIKNELKYEKSAEIEWKTVHSFLNAGNYFFFYSFL